MRDHLKFVIQNWHLNKLAFENKKQIKYIVTAFAPEDISNEEENYETLKN